MPPRSFHNNEYLFCHGLARFVLLAVYELRQAPKRMRWVPLSAVRRATKKQLHFRECELEDHVLEAAIDLCLSMKWLYRTDDTVKLEIVGEAALGPGSVLADSAISLAYPPARIAKERVVDDSTDDDSRQRLAEQLLDLLDRFLDRSKGNPFACDPRITCDRAITLAELLCWAQARGMTSQETWGAVGILVRTGHAVLVPCGAYWPITLIVRNSKLTSRSSRAIRSDIIQYDPEDGEPDYPHALVEKTIHDLLGQTAMPLQVRLDRLPNRWLRSKAERVAMTPECPDRGLRFWGLCELANLVLPKVKTGRLPPALRGERQHRPWTTDVQGVEGEKVRKAMFSLGRPDRRGLAGAISTLVDVGRITVDETEFPEFGKGFPEHWSAPVFLACPKDNGSNDDKKPPKPRCKPKKRGAHRLSDRANRAWELHQDGLTYSRIGDALVPKCSRQTAHRLVKGVEAKLREATSRSVNLGMAFSLTDGDHPGVRKKSQRPRSRES